MRRFRFWLVDVLLGCVRLVHPDRRVRERPERTVWQIIEVPRRISEREAKDLAAQVTNL